MGIPNNHNYTQVVQTNSSQQRNSPAQSPSGGIPLSPLSPPPPQPQATFRQDNGCAFAVGSFAHLNVCRHLVKCPWAKLPKDNTPTLSLFKQRIIPAKRRLPSLFKSQECKTEARRDAAEGLGQIPPDQGVSESLSLLPFSLQSLDLRYREREIRELVGFFKYLPNRQLELGRGLPRPTHTTWHVGS